VIITTNTEDRFATFKALIVSNLILYIRQARRDGTTAMSEQNLRMVVRTPTAAPGPRGTNAQFVYAGMFHEAVERLPATYRKFVYL